MRLTLVLILLAASCATTKPASSDATPAPSPSVVQNPSAGHQGIVPGEHVGPLTPTTTHADLQVRLGSAAVTNDDIDIGEGQVQAGTVIHGGTEHELRAVWRTPAREQLAWVHVVGSAWQLPNGLSPGASFAAVQDHMGAFTLNGFLGDTSGIVHLDGTTLEPYANSTTLRLVVDPTKPACQSNELQQSKLTSDAPSLAACAPHLGDLIVRF